jgi:hypothetical protein
VHMVVDNSDVGQVDHRVRMTDRQLLRASIGLAVD